MLCRLGLEIPAGDEHRQASARRLFIIDNQNLFFSHSVLKAFPVYDVPDPVWFRGRRR